MPRKFSKDSSAINKVGMRSETKRKFEQARRISRLSFVEIADLAIDLYLKKIGKKGP